MYKATKLIEKTFAENGVKHRATDHGELSMIEAGFGIDNGPNVIVRFLNSDNDNDVKIACWGIVNSVTEAKRAAVLGACNELNCEYRYVKFTLDKDGDINVQYDLPVRITDDCVGEAALEIFVRFMKILDDAYAKLMKAIYA